MGDLSTLADPGFQGWSELSDLGTAANGPAGNMNAYGADPVGMFQALGDLFDSAIGAAGNFQGKVAFSTERITEKLSLLKQNSADANRREVT